MSVKTPQAIAKQSQSEYVYITDRKFISKIINEFINENESHPAKQRPSNSEHCYNREDVIKALSRIQLTYRTKYTPDQKTNINTDQFKSALLNSMASLDNVAIPRTMNQIDGRTIDFVEMIFGAFLRDNNISNAIKSLLLRLQIPIIKTSLLDKDFFYDDAHPARKVLNTIAHIGIGVENENNSLYKTMDFIIEQLLRSFDKNLVSFNTAFVSLKRLTDIENKKQTNNEKQIKLKIRQELARQAVLTELQYYTMGISLPTPVQPLILKHWSTLMCHRYIKYGSESDSWNEATGILEHLSRSFKPIENKDDWLSLKCRYAGTVATVKSLLAETNQNKEKVFMAIRNLNNTYEKLLQQHSDYEDDTIDTPTSGGSSTQNIDYSGTQTSRPDDEKTLLARKKIDHLPKHVRPNAWFEIYTGEDKSIRRLKLSVIIKETACLVFVDRKGTKVIEKDAFVFAKELENNKSRLIDDYEVFDHALSKVIGGIATK